MNKTTTQSKEFAKTMSKYKQIIDSDIAECSQTLLTDTHESFGEHPTEAVKAYVDILNRGGKRIRGSLTITAYKMLGGKDENVALEAARAIEMLHAYILIIDDIQDRSETRRGGPTAHIALKNYHHKKHMKDDSQHFGESIAIDGALFGLHNAVNVLADMNVASDIKIAAINKVNKHFMATLHGQTMDIYNEVLETVEESAVEKVLLWKTAYYSFMNPLQLGAILAGANETELQKLEEFSMHAGRVFQITDDILGVYGDEFQSGKSTLDDIKEGKRTLLTVKALELAPKADAYFLEQMLGNKKLTTAEFVRCKEIIEQSGALNYTRRQAKNSVVDALSALDKSKKSWDKRHLSFLESLVKYLPNRTS